jgi:hypothetical protein
MKRKLWLNHVVLLLFVLITRRYEHLRNVNSAETTLPLGSCHSLLHLTHFLSDHTETMP